MSKAPAITESDRALYFSKLYPSDMVRRLIAGLGPRRCAIEAQRLSFSLSPSSSSSSRRRVESGTDDSEQSDSDSDGEKGGGGGPCTWTIRHAHLSAHQFVGAFASPMTLRTYTATRPGLLSFHVHSAAVRADLAVGHRRVYLFEEREFVLDMDLREHEARFPNSRKLLCACDLKSVCQTCWLLAEMGAAAAVALCSDDSLFALGPVMPVFSGGKGCHLWWGAPAARRLDESDRLEILARLQKPETAPPTVLKALGDVWLRRAIVSRALLADPTRSRLADYLRREYAPPGFAWATELKQAHTPQAQSLAQWQCFAKAVDEAQCQKIYIHFGWPVVDAPVTAGTSMHMIKTPFSIHSSTGRVALPLASMSACDPEKMPRADDPRLAENPLWRDGIKVFQQWLDACEYPRNTRV